MKTKKLLLFSTAALLGLTLGIGGANADSTTNSSTTTATNLVANNDSSQGETSQETVASTTDNAGQQVNAVNEEQQTSSDQQIAVTTSQAKASDYSYGWHSTWNGQDAEIPYTWTYVKSDGTKANSEWLQDNGSWYYFDGSGDMVSNGWWSAPWHGQDDEYYFDANGHYETNCWHSVWNGQSASIPYTWSYSKADGTRAKDEWLWINGSWYYFDGSGDMVSNGWWSAPWYGQDNEYYFDANGHYETNCWHSVWNGQAASIPYTWSYSKADGTRAKDEWLWINGSWYYFDGSGDMVSNGWWSAPWYGQDNEYYFDANGHYETNCWHSVWNGQAASIPYTWSYSKADGTRAKDEWLWINGSWYYFDGSGDMVSNGWYYAPWNGNDREYYFDANGHCL
ncbi:hypothetical protein [Limosilactobacillus sp.]|uniref:hypothetical protein n=1 Tax=Limosilactobacillus sp. TaxID=2773925 RepID=UPI0025C12B12|nr:hypothetical protein [Limosilactobacillus sp.]MCH3922934.1 hypothetical protein [Limosilactobacillus sp.]MCH3927617.1 hypothetical protein [Limosilactobacillus sp.]